MGLCDLKVFYFNFVQIERVSQLFSNLVCMSHIASSVIQRPEMHFNTSIVLTIILYCVYPFVLGV